MVTLVHDDVAVSGNDVIDLAFRTRLWIIATSIRLVPVRFPPPMTPISLRGIPRNSDSWATHWSQASSVSGTYQSAPWLLGTPNDALQAVLQREDLHAAGGIRWRTGSPESSVRVSSTPTPDGEPIQRQR
jgi:hypothetical protein